MSETQSKTTVTHDPIAETFTLSKGEWSNTYGIETLSYWLGWYRQQREKFPRAGKSYDETITGLEALSAKLAKADRSAQPSGPASGQV